MGLTDEQITAAAKAMYETSNMVVHVKADHLMSWQRQPGEVRSSYRQMARVAAPYLQLPWESPTKEENAQIRDEARGITEISGIVHYALETFVRYRNAALLPKPVDPRREGIVVILGKNGIDRTEQVADAILKHIDEVK